MKERLHKLLSIKSLVTLSLTAVFSAMVLRNQVATAEFLTVYTIIIGFYFGTQIEKNGGKNL